MGITKSNLFTKEQNEKAAMFKALAHPARVAIVELLLTKQGCICGDIVNELKLSQPTISQHLKELKKVGVIKGNISGKSICYELNTDAIEKMFSYCCCLLPNSSSLNTSK